MFITYPQAPAASATAPPDSHSPPSARDLTRPA